MKKLIAFAVASLVSASAFAAQFPDIGVSDVKAAVDANSAVIIDVNGPASYKAGHVPGALSWAEIKSDLAAKLPADKNTLIIAYCGSPKCGAYAAAANAAKKLGYTNVKRMSAGISGWKAANMPTEPGK